MKTIDKLKKQTQAKIKAATDKETLLITLGKDAHKKGTELKEGFGSQDLKPTYKEYMDWLLKKYGVKILCKPASRNQSDFGVHVYYCK